MLSLHGSSPQTTQDRRALDSSRFVHSTTSSTAQSVVSHSWEKHHRAYRVVFCGCIEEIVVHIQGSRKVQEESLDIALESQSKPGYSFGCIQAEDIRWRQSQTGDCLQQTTETLRVKADLIRGVAETSRVPTDFRNRECGVGILEYDCPDEIFAFHQD